MRNINDLVELVKGKKYYSLPDSFVEKIAKAYLKKYPKQEKIAENIGTKQHKALVRSIRSELHASYGRFQTKKKGKRELYAKDLPSMQAHEQLLRTNTSTNERLQQYQELYEQLFAITGKPKSILDLGCGINPVSFPFMRLQKVKYKAYDIATEDVQFLHKYFKQMKISGEAKVLDVSDLEKIKQLEKSDVAFLFAVLDPLERGKGHKLSEELLLIIPAKWLVVSFSIKTVSGRQMNHPFRGWIEQMLTRRGLSFERFMTNNELFYVIKR